MVTDAKCIPCACIAIERAYLVHLSQKYTFGGKTIPHKQTFVSIYNFSMQFL